MLTALTEEASRQISQVLSGLIEQVEAEAVFFCDRGGNIIAHQSVSDYSAMENIAALAAGSFFATLEMARLIGESEFQYLLHQGEKMSIYMEVTVSEMLLIVVFSKDSNPGLVKLYTRHAKEQLAEYDFSVHSGTNAAIQSLELQMNDTSAGFEDKRTPGKK